MISLVQSGESVKRASKRASFMVIIGLLGTFLGRKLNHSPHSHLSLYAGCSLIRGLVFLIVLHSFQLRQPP